MMRSSNNGDDDALEREFPSGDGTAQTDAQVQCPYCGATVEITLDPGSGSSQDYIEDCEVCCRPWRVVVQYDDDGGVTVEVSALE